MKLNIHDLLLTKCETKRANERLVTNHDRDGRDHRQAQSPNGPQLEPLALTHLERSPFSPSLTSISLDLQNNQFPLFAVNIPYTCTHIIYHIHITLAYAYIYVCIYTYAKTCTNPYLRRTYAIARKVSSSARMPQKESWQQGQQQINQTGNLDKNLQKWT